MAKSSATASMELPFELPFDRVQFAEIGEDGPLSGQSAFRGVPCRFSRNHTSPLRQGLRGKLFDLTPVDESQGLPLLAEGNFREARGGAGGLEVFWNFMGCPLVEEDPAIRERFAGFLERLAAGTATPFHLAAFFLQHYPDAEVEETRRACVGLLYHFDDAMTGARQSPQREQILAWAAELRGNKDRHTTGD